MSDGITKAELRAALVEAAEREQKSALKGYIGIGMTAVGMIAAIVVWFATREVGINDIKNQAKTNAAQVADLRARVGRIEASISSEGRTLVGALGKLETIEQAVEDMRADVRDLRGDLKRRR